MKIVGIIGPYFSGGDRRLIDHNIANCRALMCAIAKRFGENKLVGFFGPHSHTARFEREVDVPESYYHALDDALYDRACDGVVCLPNWEESSGARRDIDRALENGKRIFVLMSYEASVVASLLDELEAWARFT